MRLDRLVKEIFKEKFPPQKVLFRVDAGRIKGLSFGHLFRCMLLARQLRRSFGTKVVFLMNDYKDGVSCARSFGYRVATLKPLLSRGGHDKAVIEHIQKIMPDHLVVDLPFGTPNIYLDHARSNRISTVCIDDMARRSFRADVVVNSGILAQRHRYRTCLPGTRFLLGMEYFPRDERHVYKKVSKRSGSARVLLTFGGSDPMGLTEKAARSLSKLGSEDVKFEVVLGPGFKGRRSIISALRPLAGKAAIIDYPKDLRKYFQRSDLVVSAGGTTLYELYAIGKPCIAIASNEFESEIVEKFRKRKLIFAGLAKWDERLFLKALKRYINRYKGLI